MKVQFLSAILHGSTAQNYHAEGAMKKKITIKGRFKKSLGSVSLSHTFSLFSVEKESVFVFSCSDKKSKKPACNPPTGKKSAYVCVSSHIRVSTAG